MKTKFLSTDEFNVIVVDWSCGNEFPYFQAVQNSKVTASELAKLINFLKDSRGANRRLPPDWPQPGQPHRGAGGARSAASGQDFSNLERTSPRAASEELEPSSSKLFEGGSRVEVLGLRSQVGHVDFYPNGVKINPGAIVLLSLSLPRIEYIGSVFCAVFQYQVIVETGCGHEYCPEATESTAGYNLGVIRMELQTRDGKLARLNMDDNVDQEVKPGAQYVYLATSRFPLGEIRGAKVWWGRSSKPEAPPTFRSISIPLNLKKMQVVPIDLPEKKCKFSIPETTVLCGSPEKIIQKNQFLDLTVNDC
ncbi:pancreatic lipase-related protein 1 [Caerostris extrusa]|uniref:Pancreatic lipase-related protein 1 n=1 Tax=Caerostris extrusa TaxID=172846 RepID=A0AAV4V1R7_CAEEX|nr:pancreatic lipase-related protein 1 [Caerostris extrusa]